MSTEQAIIEDMLKGAKVLKPMSDGVLLANGATLKPEPVEWLWKEWLALGKLHLLAGTPGQGKTTIAMALAAITTTGGYWPDGTKSDIGNVVIWSGEDDCADTLLPRLLASGADRNRVYFVTGSRIEGKEVSFDPARDMDELKHAVNRIGNVKLIVVDPIVTAVTGDSHKNTETRRDLQPLVDLASDVNAALLGITHMSKGGAGGDPAQRVLGSVAFVAVARIVMVAAKVPNDEGLDKRVFARAKSNIGRDDGGFEYSLEQAEPIVGIQTSNVMWGSSVSGTAQELLAEPEAESGGALFEAKLFLTDLLKNGKMAAKEVKSNANDAGLSAATLRRAKDAIGIKPEKCADAWYWELPSKKLSYQQVKDGES